MLSERNRGIPRRGRKKFNVDESYFENIDTEEKAYWLGFLFAEGSLDIKRYCLCLKLGQIDKEQVEKFKIAIKSEHKINQTKDGRNAWVIKIGSKKISNSLIKYGFGSGKSLNIKLPKLKQNLIHHFIRGYFDGDGWISKDKRNNYIVGFCSCSKKMLIDVQNWINKKLNVQCGSIITRKRNHIPNQHDSFRLHYAGNFITKYIGNILYEEAKIFLSRKAEKFHNINTKYVKQSKFKHL